MSRNEKHLASRLAYWRMTVGKRPTEEVTTLCNVTEDQVPRLAASYEGDLQAAVAAFKSHVAPALENRGLSFEDACDVNPGRPDHPGGRACHLRPKTALSQPLCRLRQRGSFS